MCCAVRRMGVGGVGCCRRAIAIIRSFRIISLGPARAFATNAHAPH